MSATMWDPDGTGPRTPVLVCAGPFTGIADIVASGLATYEPSTGQWRATGDPMLDSAPTGVNHVTVAPDGSLVTGPCTLGAQPVLAARWGGVAWSAVAPLPSRVNQLLVEGVAALPNGDVAVIGWEWTSAMTGAVLVAHNGVVTDVALGSFITRPKAICAEANGDILLGSAQGLLRWNGATWSTLVVGSVTAIRPVVGGHLLSGNVFPGGYRLAVYVDVLQGIVAGWTVSELQSEPSALLSTGQGMVVAGLFGPSGSFPQSDVRRWNGSTWSSVGDGVLQTGWSYAQTGFVRGLVELPGGDILAYGQFQDAGDRSVANIARADGTRWTPINGGLAAEVRSLTTLPNGAVVAAAQRFVMQRVGSVWSEMGHANDLVFAVATMRNGDLIAAGQFTSIDGVPARGVARWSGSSWRPLGTGLQDGSYAALARAVQEMPNGDLVVCGTFSTAGGVSASSVARWDGTAWHDMAPGLAAYEYFRCLGRLPNGEVVASPINGGYVKRWDGSAWQLLGTLPSGAVDAFTNAPSGELLAAGRFSGNGNAVAWTGSTWNFLGSAAATGFYPASPVALTVMPNGDVILCGQGSGQGVVTRWNGSGWTSLQPHITAPYRINSIVQANGRLIAGGDFSCITNGVPTFGVAELATPCPALAEPYGDACSGSGGQFLLRATTLPWSGSTFRASLSGFASSSIGAWLLGAHQTDVPVASVFAPGTSSCPMLVQPDAVGLLFPVARRAELTISVPSSQALVGFTGYLQAAQLELDASLAVTRVATSNGLRLKVGSF